MEPERPIEKTLRACAKTRGEEAGPPLELHPATRRLLQGEVARKYGSRPPKAGRVLSLFARLRPRLALAVGLAMIAAVLAWQFLPTTRKEDKKVFLAGKEAAPAAAPASAPAESTIAAATPPPMVKTPAALSYADKEEGEQAVLADNGLAVATAQETKRQAGQPKTIIEEQAHSFLVPQPAPIAPQTNFSTQNFAKTGPALEPDDSGDKAAAASVLTSFKVEQSGSELRIIDEDSSVYVGHVQFVDPGNPAGTPAPQAPPAFRQSEPKATQKPGSMAARKLTAGPVLKNYSFRVAGTNLSLHQKVVFTGNLVASTNSASPFSRAQISGRAVIDGKEIRIDAASKNVTNDK